MTEVSRLTSTTHDCYYCRIPGGETRDLCNRHKLIHTHVEHYRRTTEDTRIPGVHPLSST